MTSGTKTATSQNGASKAVPVADSNGTSKIEVSNNVSDRIKFISTILLGYVVHIRVS